MTDRQAYSLYESTRPAKQNRKRLSSWILTDPYLRNFHREIVMTTFSGTILSVPLFRKMHGLESDPSTEPGNGPAKNLASLVSISTVAPVTLQQSLFTKTQASRLNRYVGQQEPGLLGLSCAIYRLTWRTLLKSIASQSLGGKNATA